jgi:cobyrinic acid a,c-diamide synthase
VAPFKKGPDYIDAAWLTRAAQTPCHNLDLFLFSASAAFRSVVTATSDADLAIIEGNRGLFDGMDAEGTFSSGELAKLLRAPVLLSVDATKTTRTAAAQVLGCQTLDPDVSLAGVVLSRVAGTRHEKVLRESVEGICGIPVVGAIPKLPEDIFPERHLGLIPPQETAEIEGPLVRVRETAEKYLDLDTILDLARTAEPALFPGEEPGPPHDSSPQPTRFLPPEVGQDSTPGSGTTKTPTARIGVFRDAAFQFYYPENLDAIAAAGGEVVEISPIEDGDLPAVDALYLGGGFPETMAPELSRNTSFMASVRAAAEVGLPIYAECGGAVYLGETLEYESETFALVGALPVAFGFHKKPRGHGYTVLEVVGENPFYPVGQRIRGHEFHYTFLTSPQHGELSFAFKVHRGIGFGSGHDGIRLRNVLATYTHVHALGTPGWAPALEQKAVQFKSQSSDESSSGSSQN